MNNIVIRLALVILVLESFLIHLYPLTSFHFGGSVVGVRIIGAVGIVSGAYLLSEYIQSRFLDTVPTDMTPFLTGMLVVLLEMFIYKKYSFAGFTPGTDLDFFNKVLAKFAFTVCSVFIAKGTF